MSRRISRDTSLADALFSPNRAAPILAIPSPVLEREIAAARKEYDKAVALLEQAVRLAEAALWKHLLVELMRASER